MPPPRRRPEEAARGTPGRDCLRPARTGRRCAFPDITFDLADIVIGPQGVCEEAHVTATHAAQWLGIEPSGERLEWDVVIWFPWDAERRLFRGEKVYVSGIDLPHVAKHEGA